MCDVSDGATEWEYGLVSQWKHERVDKVERRQRRNRTLRLYEQGGMFLWWAKRKDNRVWVDVRDWASGWEYELVSQWVSENMSEIVTATS